jgi:hypothetical protein
MTPELYCMRIDVAILDNTIHWLSFARAIGTNYCLLHPHKHNIECCKMHVTWNSQLVPAEERTFTCPAVCRDMRLGDR